MTGKKSKILWGCLGAAVVVGAVWWGVSNRAPKSTLVRQEVPVAAKIDEEAQSITKTPTEAQEGVIEASLAIFDVLAAYGWSSPEALQHFGALLQRAGIQLDFKNLNQKQSTEAVLQWLLTLIQETQLKFWNRQGGKERWQTKVLPWIQADPKGVAEDITALGLTSSVLPKFGPKGTVCILGAAGHRMQARLRFLKQLIQTDQLAPEQIILLSGERKVSVGVDGSENELKALATKRGVEAWQDLTEMDLLKDLVESDAFFQAFKVVPVFTKANTRTDGSIQRPTTQTTVMEWLKTNPPVGTVYMISNQPYVSSQEACIRSVFVAQNRTGDQLQVVGEGYDEGEPTNEDIKSWVEALGGTLRAAAPLVLKQLGITIPRSLMPEFQKLYQNDALATSLLRRLGA